MTLAQSTELLKVYWEPLRRSLTEKVRRKGFGWTPCEHYPYNCIGWCPACLELQGTIERLVRDYGEP